MWPKNNKDQPDAMSAVKEDISKLWQSLASLSAKLTQLSQDTRSSPQQELLERVEGLERRFSSLHSLLTEKSPATGAERLSKTGKAFRAIYNRSP